MQSTSPAAFRLVPLSQASQRRSASQHFFHSAFPRNRTHEGVDRHISHEPPCKPALAKDLEDVDAAFCKTLNLACLACLAATITSLAKS